LLFEIFGLIALVFCILIIAAAYDHGLAMWWIVAVSAHNRYGLKIFC